MFPRIIQYRSAVIHVKNFNQELPPRPIPKFQPVKELTPEESKKLIEAMIKYQSSISDPIFACK